jgi:CRP/FNR family cyclic AMP-dependent transcriptional regulator
MVGARVTGNSSKRSNMKFLKMFKNWEDVLEYPAQTVIFSAGDVADVIYYIMSGEVELTLRGESLGTEKAGKIIGVLSMIPSATHGAMATTQTKVKLARLSRKQLRKLTSENNDFSLHVMTVLANRLRSIDQYITTQFAQSD